MSDIWYYAVNDKTVGPLSLADLTTILSRRDVDAENLLVWRAGFKQWQKAETVPELKVFVIKPPPLPASLPSEAPLSLGQPLRVDSQERALAGYPSKPKRRNFIGSIVSVILIALFIGGVRYLTHSGGSISHPDSEIISGSGRQEFVSGGIKTCMRKQENDPDTKSLSLSSEVISKYCSCYMNSLADTITYGDLKTVGKDGIGALKGKVSAADTSCTDKMRRSLLGSH